MLKRMFTFLAALLLTAGVAVPAAQAALVDLGEPIQPHGYPAWYSDGNVALELCVPAPAGNATRTDLCIGDPIDPDHPLVMTGEGFYYMAFASIPLANGGGASIEFAIESTFGGLEEPIDGQQITFGRTRIRIDTPVVGTYNITHPYSADPVVFEVGDADADGEPDGINMTADIGSANFLNPALAFRGTLTSPIGPYLTWENYATNPALQVRAIDELTGEPTGPVLEQYVGDPNIPSPVVGGPFGNTFRVDGPAGSNLDGLGNDFVETNLWGIMGKVNDPADDGNLYTYTNVEVPNLFAVGPVNRVTTLSPTSTAVAAGDSFSESYSLGYPHWYQENIGTVEAPVGGLQLTLCPPGDAMCISEAINPLAVDPNPNDGIAEGPVALVTGGEGFWYSAAAAFDVGDDSYHIEYALESTFGGGEEMIDGNQISFTRERIRFNFGGDKPAATYRVTHPYGVRILEPQPDRLDRVRFVADIGIADLADPDGAYVGALYGIVGPQFLKWDTFVDPSTLTAEQLGANYPVPELVTQNPETGLYSYHVGNPTIPHTITGGHNGDIFRVERLASGTVEDGEWELIGETDLFTVSGKIFDPATFEFVIIANAPVAIADTANLNLNLASAVTVNVLANDIFDTSATVTLLPAGEAFGPDSGTAVVNADGSVTYTPGAALAADGGLDTFGYNIVDASGLTSNNAVVTINVTPAEVLTIDRARLDTRRLRLDLRGTSNGTAALTIHAGGDTSGAVLGTATPRNGRWSFRGTATSAIDQITVASPNTTVSSAVQTR